MQGRRRSPRRRGGDRAGVAMAVPSAKRRRMPSRRNKRSAAVEAEIANDSELSGAGDEGAARHEAGAEGLPFQGSDGEAKEMEMDSEEQADASKQAESADDRSVAETAAEDEEAQQSEAEVARAGKDWLGAHVQQKLKDGRTATGCGGSWARWSR